MSFLLLSLHSCLGGRLDMAFRVSRHAGFLGDKIEAVFYFLSQRSLYGFDTNRKAPDLRNREKSRTRSIKEKNEGILLSKFEI